MVDQTGEYDSFDSTEEVQSQSFDNILTWKNETEWPCDLLLCGMQDCVIAYDTEVNLQREAISLPQNSQSRQDVIILRETNGEGKKYSDALKKVELFVEHELLVFRKNKLNLEKIGIHTALSYERVKIILKFNKGSQNLQKP